MGIRNKKTFKIDTVLGVDLTSHPSKVSKNRASYMKNTLHVGGVNRKRKGFHQVLKLLDSSDVPLRINGIHPYTDKSGCQRLLIHAGNCLFNEKGEKIFTSLEITDTPSRFLTVNQTGYLMGCGGLYAFDGESLSSPVPYVPTVMRGYDRAFGSDTEAEPPNLLTPKVRLEYCGERHDKGRDGVFNLPYDVDWNKEFTLTVRVSPTYNNIRLMEGDGYNMDVDSRVDSEVSATFTLRGGDTDITREFICKSFTKSGMKMYLFDENAIPTSRMPTLYIIGNKNAFYLNLDTSPEKTGDFNIEVSYCRRDIPSDGVRSAPFGEAVQDNRGETRLVLRGGAGCESKIFYSDSFERQGIAYFPECCSVTVGDGGNITALMSLSDRYLGVFKGERFYRYAIYHYPAAASPEERYYLNGYEGRDRHGCINNLCCGRQGADLIVFDGTGAYGIEEISSESDRCFLSLRSSNIEKALKSHTPKEISESCACVWDGRYVLFIGNRAYIADTRHTFGNGASYEYEWWMWECPEARCACEINGKLYLGDSRGGVFILGDDYRDIEIIKNTRDGDAVYSPDTGLFTINRETGVESATHVRLTGIASFLKKGDFEAYLSTSSGISHICISAPDGLWRIKEGEKLLIRTGNGSEREGYAAFTGEDEEKGTFSVFGISDIAPEDIESIGIYENGEREYALVKEEGGYATYLDSTRVYWEFTDTSPALSLIKWENVEAVYVSPMVNFGENRLKTLYKLGISVLSKDASHVLFGYETRKSSLAPLKGMEGFDLASFDLDRLSLEYPFAKTLEKRVFERSFNYVAFKLVSRDNCDLALGEIYAVYSVNGSIHGVR